MGADRLWMYRRPVTDDRTPYEADEDAENTQGTKRVWLAGTLLACGAIVAVVLARRRRLTPRRVALRTADPGVTFVELLAGVGDSLAGYDDARAREAYLDSARLRSSVRRHAARRDEGRDRVYRTSTDPSRTTSVTFGDGVSGAKPPSGTDKVTAGYRTGIGATGNVDHTNNDDLVCLCAWARPVTAAENPDVGEVASGGADTSSRRFMVWSWPPNG
jgi:hypothetical protein